MNLNLIILEQMVSRMYADHKINSLIHITLKVQKVWGCFSSSSVGPIHLIIDIMTTDV